MCPQQMNENHVFLKPAGRCCFLNSEKVGKKILIIGKKIS